MQMQKGELVSRFGKWKWSEERKAVFLTKADATLAAFKRRAAIMNEIRHKMQHDAARATTARLDLMQSRYDRLKEAVEETAIEWKLLRRRARG